MKNPRITAKERGLLKGACRRVFSRSDLRKEALEATRIKHTDPDRPRVKKWSRCSTCKEITPSYLIEIDHVLPVIPTNSSLEEMSWDEMINRLWCDNNNLTGICKPCHNSKCTVERKERLKYKKERKNER